MINTIIQKYTGVIFAIAVTFLVLWSMLLPEYILTLDMVFTPHIPFTLPAQGFWNSIPLNYLLYLASLVMSGWVIQKVMLILLFFTLSFLSYTYLPVPQNKIVKLFSACIYTLNPFVYTRLLAGHWTHLFGYALLPFFINTLLCYTVEPTTKNCFKLFGSLFVISIFSLHFFLMACIITGLWILFSDTKKLFSPDYLHILSMGFVAFLFATSYWTVPALLNTHPITNNFTEEHWQVFAAAPHGKIPVLLNLASLNGFWAEGQAWKNYFAWPQEHIVFWIALLGLYTLVVAGAVKLWKSNRDYALFFIFITVCSFIVSTGVANTPFKSLNHLLYAHIPFWSGFRDSQKFIGLVALCFSILSGYGLGALLQKYKQRQQVSLYIKYGIFLIPLVLGMFMFGGYAKQLQAVRYPGTWVEAKQILDSTSSHDAVLALPWQGYMSFNFNNKLIIANPAQSFFGKNVVVSQNFRLGSIYDQTPDDAYVSLDKAIRHNDPENSQSMAEFLLSEHITQVLFFKDLIGVDTLTYSFLQSKGFKRTFDTPELSIYSIQNTAEVD